MWRKPDNAFLMMNLCCRDAMLSITTSHDQTFYSYHSHLLSRLLSCHFMNVLTIVYTIVEKLVPVEEDAVVAGVEFSLPLNIVDSSILEPLRILSQKSGVTIGAEVLEYLSYGMQMHVTNVLEACIKMSNKRRNVVGVKMYTTLHDKVTVRGERPDPKTTLGIMWGPHVSQLLSNQEKAIKEELKSREAEEEASLVKEMKSYDEEKRAIAVLGGKRSRGAQAEAVEAPWWVKEVRWLALLKNARISLHQRLKWTYVFIGNRDC